MKKDEHLPQDTFCKETLCENTHPPFLVKRIAWLMSPDRIRKLLPGCNIPRKMVLLMLP